MASRRRRVPRPQDTGIPGGDAIADLWEWNRKPVASTCVYVLDPAGHELRSGRVET
ncbi:hypothetical protein ACFYW8_31355 [Streptomyces sp. NPDC002742]|uniref:hypothetical protein n=1 Tax=Streptomyces sp. NPDC002742 TaxID=3364663 RepID=UPI0036BE9444